MRWIVTATLAGESPTISPIASALFEIQENDLPLERLEPLDYIERERRW